MANVTAARLCPLAVVMISRDEAHNLDAVAANLAGFAAEVWLLDSYSTDDFLSCRAAILAAMDSPSIDGVNTWFVSRAAHNAGLKVALSGLGGDELLGGYSDFETMPRPRRWLAAPSRVPFLPALFAAAVRGTGLSRRRPKLPGLLTHGGDLRSIYLLSRSLALPMELDSFLDPQLARAGLEELDLPALVSADDLPTDESRAIRLLLAGNYMRSQLLRDADWSSMDHSLEVRVPLVDRALWQTVIGLHKGGHRFAKSDMAQAMRAPLPADFVRRPKTGFAVPVPRWIAESAGLTQDSEPGLRGWAREVARAFAA